ncbi:substrate-binding domain-containing protein [Streptomyces milbemycinicus]|uniref:Nitrate ABC transporter substrate-binding protein n=1 Tax=Streptomyces milbemycinicus TaxID=476552 RepID=A0ABW8M212_9ACTN
MPSSIRRAALLGVSTAITLVSVTACGGGSTASAGSADKLKAAPAAQRLAGVCPKTVVVQADWEPEAEHGPLYNLVGPGYTVDTAKKRVTGPLVIGGKDTGVKIQIRAGGSAIGYQSVPSQMYLDQSITLGTVTTDTAIAASAKQPVTAVAALMKKSPMVLMWDPATHPGWKTIADIGTSNAKVVYVNGSTYASLLVDKGLIKKSQLDGSYDGAPARFVANPGIAQQGFATAEPYIYQHEVSAWKKPIKYQLLADVGFNVYPESLSVRSGELKSLSPCLKKLVPVLQQSAADFASKPSATVKLISDLVQQYNTSWVYSESTGSFAAKQMVKLGILGNEADGGIGGFDMKRVASALKTFTPFVEQSGAKVKPGLTAQDLATDEFIDTSIGMK